MSAASTVGSSSRRPLMVLDPKLLPRVLAYLNAQELQFGNDARIQVEDIVDHLRSKHSEYNRKPYNALLKQVGKLCDEQRDRAKRDAAAAAAATADAGGGVAETSSNSDKVAMDEGADGGAEEDDDVEVIELEDKNIVNASMRALYKTPVKSTQLSTASTIITAVAPTPTRTLSAPATQPSSVTAAPDQTSSSSSSSSSLNPKKRKKYRTNSSSTLSATTPSPSSSSPSDSWQPTFISPNLSYSDLGGLSSTLQDLRELIHYPLLHPELYSHLGLSPPSGVLLHGPAGCGKSLLSQAIAGEVSRMGGVRCIAISGPEVVGGVSGESEGRIRKLFDEAKRCAPCVVLIDEIDAITGKREQAQREMERRIVAQLLTEMDNLQPQRRRAATPAAAASTDGDVTELSIVDDDAHKLVIVIGATNRPDSLDPALRRAGRFDREIALHLPDESGREEILRVMCREMRVEQAVNWKEIAKKAVGYVGADLSALTKEAAVIAVNRIFRRLEVTEAEERAAAGEGAGQQQQPMETADSITVNGQPSHAATAHAIPSSSSSRHQQSVVDLHHRTQASSRLALHADPLPPALLSSLSILHTDFMAALNKVQPSAKREGFSSAPDVSWNDIGALSGLHEELSLLVLQPILCPEQFEAIGLTSPAGVLLYGPPGCGKTLVARAIAGESGASFLSVKGPELLNLFVGESERAVRRVFERARSSAPCVIFFDELDALCPRRGAGSGAGGGGGGEGSNVSERVVNQLLTEMDGLEGRGRVFVIGATNRPDMIDAAMLRPGRLEKLVYVPLPTQHERESILDKHMRKCPLRSQPNSPQYKAQLISRIAADRRSDRLSGADLAALVREATIAALKAAQRARWAGGPTAAVAAGAGEVLSVEVDWEHFDVALEKVRPSVSVEAERRYEKMSKTLRRARATLTEIVEDKHDDKRLKQEEHTQQESSSSSSSSGRKSPE